MGGEERRGRGVHLVYLTRVVVNVTSLNYVPSI